MYGEIKYMVPEYPIYDYLTKFGWKYKHMTSSKRVPTWHCKIRFWRKSMVLKIHLNTGQIPGTPAKGNKKNAVNSEGYPF